MNKMIRRIAAMTAAALLLASAGAALAEVTAEKTTEKDKVTKITWKDEQGYVAAGPEGYASVRYKYAGAKTTETYYGTDGEPYEMPGGYYGRAVTTDNKKRVARIDYLGKDGKPTMTKPGYASVSYSYYSFNAEHKVIYYNERGKMVKVPSLGYAQIENSYSGWKLVGRKYMDEKGKPAESIRDGYATMTMKMNRKHTEVIRITYTHADGSPAAGPEGWHRCEIDRDKKERASEIRYYDEQDNLTDRGGYAKETYAYDKEGDMLISRYDAKGNRISFGGDAVILFRRVKDDAIQVETYMNEAEEIITMPEGYSTIEYSYNKNGQLTLVQYRNAAGDRVKCSKGYSAVQTLWDVQGRLLSRAYLDEAGQSVNSTDGVCTEQYTYDEDGRITKVVRLNAEGKTVTD